MTDTKGMTIKEIVRASVKYNAVLCEFYNHTYRVGYLNYDCNEHGENVRVLFCPEATADYNRYFREIVKAFEPIFDPDNFSLQGWHGDYTDEEEPKENERCIILVERQSYGRTKYEIHYAWWDGKSAFYGYDHKYNPELSVLGFKHLKPNGYPY